MKLLIKILGQTRQFPALKVDFGPGYTFPWNDALRAYAYEPKSQKEIDDIFQSQAVHGVWFFAPVLIDAAVQPTKAEAAPAPAAEPPAKPTPEAEAEIARLTGLLRAAEGTIARKSAELAELKAKPSPPAPAAKKPTRPAGRAASQPPTDSPAPDLAPE